MDENVLNIDLWLVPVTENSVTQASRKQQVDRYPLNNCLSYGTGTISIQELDQRANQLARWLQNDGIGVGSLVGIYLERSIKLFIAMLAVLKPGAAYVMIDTTFPLEGVRYMLNNAEGHVFVTNKH